MSNAEIADVLDTIARILEIQDENVFKVRAYYNAARLIRGLPEPVAELARKDALKDLPGVGEALRQKLTELSATGRLEYFEKLRRSVPAGLLDMLRIPGLGPKGVKSLWRDLGVTTIKGLERACRAGKVGGLKGFGKRSEEKILEGIAFIARHAGQCRLGDALPTAKGLARYLEESGLAGRVSLAGSIRRGKAVIKDIDILASARRPEKLMEVFLKAPGVAGTVVAGKTKTSLRLESGIQVDLRVVSDDEFPYALLYFTGSKQHNVLVRQRAQRRGLKVNEYGIFKGARLLRAKTEEECYRHLGLAYIEPEIREAAGELEAAEKGDLPKLVELADIQGVFHVHSDWSDGGFKIERMADKARSMGLKYLGIADHSKAAAYANGLDERRLRRQMAEIRGLGKKWNGFRLLCGLECDILADGKLDLSPKVLSELDFVIGAVHSRFKMPEAEMTGRICRALADENLDILAHPTGRLLLERDAYAVDLEKVIESAGRHKKAIEINASPFRLDLDAASARRAAQRGVPVSIEPDAHSPDGIEDIEFGVATARRAWLTKDQVLNARPCDKALKMGKA
ncbi:MAG: DNA polymerase/3'-5' exonuclease PolX [Elusimicrobiota bacterium]